MSTSLLIITAVVFFSAAGLPPCFSADRYYEECSLPLRCGSGTQIFGNTSYPFWGMGKPKYCGQSPFNLSCNGDQHVTLRIESLTLRVVSVNLERHTISAADDSFLEGGCPEIWNFTGKDRFTLNSTTETMDLYRCRRNPEIPSLSNVTCKTSHENSTTYHFFGSQYAGQSCTISGNVPVLRSLKEDLHSNKSNLTLDDALRTGFVLRYQLEDTTCRKCYDSDGVCGSDSGSDSFRCLCEDKPHNLTCNEEREQQQQLEDEGLSLS